MVGKFFVPGYEIESRCVFFKGSDNFVCIRKYSYENDDATADHLTTNMRFDLSFFACPFSYVLHIVFSTEASLTFPVLN